MQTIAFLLKSGEKLTFSTTEPAHAVRAALLRAMEGRPVSQQTLYTLGPAEAPDAVIDMSEVAAITVQG